MGSYPEGRRFESDRGNHPLTLRPPSRPSPTQSSIPDDETSAKPSLLGLFGWFFAMWLISYLVFDGARVVIGEVLSHL